MRKGSLAISALAAATLLLAASVPAQAQSHGPANFGSVRVSASPLSAPPPSRFDPVQDDLPVGQVPLPGTAALLALGGVGLALVRRRGRGEQEPRETASTDDREGDRL